MYYVTAATAMLLGDTVPTITVTEKNLKRVTPKFEKVHGGKLFRRAPEISQFAAKVSLPQSIKTYAALLHNLKHHPDNVYFLNQRCVHCINLFKNDVNVNSTNVRWLNTGEKFIPSDVATLFSMESPCTVKEFYDAVPFPHKLENALHL